MRVWRRQRLAQSAAPPPREVEELTHVVLGKRDGADFWHVKVEGLPVNRVKEGALGRWRQWCPRERGVVIESRVRVLSHLSNEMGTFSRRQSIGQREGL